MDTIHENGASVKNFDAKAPEKTMDGVLSPVEAAVVDALRQICAYEACEGRRKIWKRTDSGVWTARPANDVVNDVTAELSETFAGLKSEAVRRFIDEYCAVEIVWRDGLMRPMAGIYEVLDMPCLVRRGMPLWVDGHPERMDDPAERERVQETNFKRKALWTLLGSDQLERAELALAGTRSDVIELGNGGSVTKSRPFIAIVGEQGLGKTMILKQILPRILGTRGIDFGRYLAGKTDFSGHLESHVLLTIDDSLGGLTARQRRTVAERIKQLLFGAGQELHLKGRDPITLKLPNMVVMCLNGDVSSLRALPIFVGKDENKSLILKAVDKLQNNETEAEKAIWNARFEDKQDTQDYVDYLDWLALNPKTDSYSTAYDERQWCRGGCLDEDLRESIKAVSPLGAAEDAVRSAITNAIDEGENVQSLRLSDVKKFIERHALRDARDAFRSACPEPRLQEEALRTLFKSLEMEPKEDKHKHAQTWDLSLLGECDEQ